MARVNKLNVSRVLRLAGYWPRDTTRMHGRGGYWSQQDGDAVRVSHRWGPEGDHLTDRERDSERTEFLAAYAEILEAAGYTCKIAYNAIRVTK